MQLRSGSCISLDWVFLNRGMIAFFNRQNHWSMMLIYF